jgi:hypothetical protein
LLSVPPENKEARQLGGLGEEQMALKIDADVAAVASFMQATLPAAKLVAVAQAIGELAPLLWRHYDRESIRPLELATSLDPAACKLAAATK